MNPVALDYQGDIENIEGAVTVSLFPLDNDGRLSASGVTCKGIEASGPSLQGLSLFGAVALEPTDVVWILLVSTLAGKIPCDGTYIVDADGRRYNVRAVRTDGMVYECITTKAGVIA